MKAVSSKQLAAENAALRKRVAELESQSETGVEATVESLSAEDAQRFRILTESAFDIVCELDAQGRFRYLSPNYRDVLNWDPQAMIGRSALDPVHPDERAAAGVQIEHSLRAGWGKLALRVQHGDGGWRWFECIGRRFLAADGEPRVLVISRDVTERIRGEQQLLEARHQLEERVRVRTAELAEANAKLLAEIADRETAEQQLRSSEERLRRVVENVPDVMLTLDREGTILYINMPTNAEANDGTSVGKSAYDWVPAKQRDAMRSAIERVFVTGEPAEYEVQEIGKPDWFHTRVGPVLSSGVVTAVTLMCRNVTAQRKEEQELRRNQQLLERRVIERTQQLAAANEQLRLDILRREETERQLRESEERFRAVAEANPVPVLISRYADGRMLYVNDRLVEIIGVERQKLLTQSTVEYYSRPEDRTQLMRALSRDGQVKDYELLGRRRDGSPMWMWVSNRRITYQGEAAVLTSFLDITDRKQHEDRMSHERAVLKQMLDLQDRDRQLTAYEIHDGLVQDMTGAAMYLEAARTAETNRERSQNLNKSLLLLQGAINEARRLINGLRPPILDEAGVVPAIEHLIADMRQLVGLKVRLKSTLRKRRLSPALENTIYRVVQETLTNVHRHSGVETASVELTELAGRVRITVRDRGQGFDPKHIPQSRFGLAGVQERARLFGGSAQIRSAPKKGATITVEIPLADVLPSADDKVNGAESSIGAAK